MAEALDMGQRTVSIGAYKGRLADGPNPTSVTEWKN